MEYFCFIFRSLLIFFIQQVLIGILFNYYEEMDRSVLSNRNVMEATYVILYCLVVTLKNKKQVKLF